ncbi:hypothetical protein K0M31_019819 [Melipona bicolor]|uniref:Uncharacterized protein n=1 Tax=Melipona bicolor TaxID=60889 RepID=A0AA40G352_9HYME|nr:hypothetical protein K0M31_019819 [Melipona bicolor]
MSLELDDDVLDKDKPLPPVNQDASVDNAAIGARHNVVESDPWTGSQQVEYVSHQEVQKPTTENQTSGCSSIDPGSGGCLGGCLILLVLTYLLGGASWGGLATSWQNVSLSVRNESDLEVDDSTSGSSSTTASPRVTMATAGTCLLQLCFTRASGEGKGWVGGVGGEETNAIAEAISSTAGNKKATERLRPADAEKKIRKDSLLFCKVSISSGTPTRCIAKCLHNPQRPNANRAARVRHYRDKHALQKFPASKFMLPVRKLKLPGYRSLSFEFFKNLVENQANFSLTSKQRTKIGKFALKHLAKT